VNCAGAPCVVPPVSRTRVSGAPAAGDCAMNNDEKDDISMLLNVCHSDNRIETIVLLVPLKLREGEHFNIITSGDGIAHYFTKNGYYDGWERRLDHIPDLTIEQAENLIEETERHRHFPQKEKSDDETE
jgi:hypothetical protein